MAIVKKLPDSELNAPGCLCRTKSSQEYIKTSNEDRTKHTLWKVVGDGYEKVMTSNLMGALDEKISYDI